MTETYKRVRAIVAERLGVEEEQVTLDSHLFDDLGADSLDIVEIIMELEQAFDITISEEETLTPTMHGLLCYVGALLEERTVTRP